MFLSEVKYRNSNYNINVALLGTDAKNKNHHRKIGHEKNIKVCMLQKSRIRSSRLTGHFNKDISQ